MTDRVLWTAIRRSRGSLLIAVTGCTTLGLNLPAGASTKFNILVGINADNTKNHPPNAAFTVSASCAAGQQLIGGGYNLINNNSGPTLVVIEGNYPSGPSTWTVQVRNPDNPSLYNGDADVVVEAGAYCLTTPNYDLSTEIVTQTVTLPQGVNATADIDVRCSQSGSLALSGGFRTTTLPVFTEPGGAVHQAFWPGLLGTGIQASAPRFPDATHSAMGWHVTQLYTPATQPTAPQPPVTTTAYAVCARKNINAQSYRLSTMSGVLGPTDVKAACQTGEFTSGGGYDGVVKVTDSEISGTHAGGSSFAFDTWTISGSSSLTPMTADALCVRIPII